MSRLPRPVSDEARSRRIEICLTNAVLFGGTVLFWAFVGAGIGRVFRLW